MIPSGSQVTASSISPLRARARHGGRGQSLATAFHPIKAADLHSGGVRLRKGEVLGAQERRVRGF